ncbi:protein chain release factor B [Belliella baltica DSM 15883]|uniref:Protein chain release factor B n=1 Tax=Belliella baltica (strain DSM 15883 / CIP 108006 / LMG 21964 / BA134) TaxID=866536 RepID=I3Z841_BELBD|nr:alternative ribosome rescue aminoacyl-tRNA hydrolase ArfB [Belliella baltica]AFL85409.1 protein chain release factor B [Belliella baltica DSM 15883]
MTIQQKIKNQALNSEFEFQTSRSSGPGGQNVNKVNSKVQLFFDVGNSQVLNEQEKSILLNKWENKLDNEGKVMFQSQEKRSQLQNKELVIRKFYDALSKAFEKKKIRKVTKPSKAAIESRIKAKKSASQKKQNRGKVDW